MGRFKRWTVGAFAALSLVGLTACPTQQPIPTPPLDATTTTTTTAPTTTTLTAYACFQMQYTGANGYRYWAAAASQQMNLRVYADGQDVVFASITTANNGCVNLVVASGYWWRVEMSNRICVNGGFSCTNYYGGSDWQWPTTNDWNFGGSAFWIYVPIVQFPG